MTAPLSLDTQLTGAFVPVTVRSVLLWDKQGCYDLQKIDRKRECETKSLIDR